jgi:hypothetical protein
MTPADDSAGVILFSGHRLISFTILLFNAKILLMNRALTSLVLALLLVVSVSAQQRPLLTDDVDIIPSGTIEVGAGVDFLQNVKLPLSGLRGDLTRAGDIRVRHGFAANVELQVEGVLQNFLAINSMTTPSPIPLNISGNSTNDSGDFILSTKIKLRNETKLLPALGFKFGFEMPNTNQARGIGTNQINIFGKVLLQKKLGSRRNNVPKFNVFGNVGLGIFTAPVNSFTQNDMLLYGLAGIYRVTDRINVVSEVNGRANTRKGAAPLGTESTGQFRIGTQIRASGLRFDTAAIFGLTRFSPRTGLTFGVTYQSPNIFTPAK